VGALRTKTLAKIREMVGTALRVLSFDPVEAARAKRSAAITLIAVIGIGAGPAIIDKFTGGMYTAAKNTLNNYSLGGIVNIVDLARYIGIVIAAIAFVNSLIKMATAE